MKHSAHILYEITSKLTIFPLFALILFPAFSRTYTGSGFLCPMRA
jgi:hypothetical protein